MAASCVWVAVSLSLEAGKSASESHQLFCSSLLVTDHTKAVCHLVHRVVKLLEG